MNFKSQIATTREQSERLLALGMKPETADMSIPIKDNPNLNCSARPYNDWNGYWKHNKFVIPAWSLNRLLEMMPKLIHIEVGDYYLLITPLWISYANIMHGEIIDEMKAISITQYGIFNELIDMIDWLIQNEYFNKEYLKQE